MGSILWCDLVRGPKVRSSKQLSLRLLGLVGLAVAVLAGCSSASSGARQAPPSSSPTPATSTTWGTAIAGSPCVTVVTPSLPPLATPNPAQATPAAATGYPEVVARVDDQPVTGAQLAQAVANIRGWAAAMQQGRVTVSASSTTVVASPAASASTLRAAPQPASAHTPSGAVGPLPSIDPALAPDADKRTVELSALNSVLRAAVLQELARIRHATVTDAEVTANIRQLMTPALESGDPSLRAAWEQNAARFGDSLDQFPTDPRVIELFRPQMVRTKMQEQLRHEILNRPELVGRPDATDILLHEAAATSNIRLEVLVDRC